MEILGLEKLENGHLFFLDEKKLKKEILQRNFLIKDLTITKVYPDKLKITINLRKPFAYLSDSRVYYTLSEEGIILKKNTDVRNLPIIQLEQESISNKTGHRVDGFIVSTIQLLQGFQKQKIDTDKIILNRNDETIRFNILDSTQVLLSLTKDNQFVPPSLQIIISRFRIEGSVPASFDFRFEKPIITLKNGDKYTP